MACRATTIKRCEMRRCWNSTTTTYTHVTHLCPQHQLCCRRSGCCSNKGFWPYLYALFITLGVALAVGCTYYCYKRHRARRANIQGQVLATVPTPPGTPPQPGYYPAPSLPQPPAYTPLPPPPPPPGFAVPPMPDYAPPPAKGYPSPPPAVPSPPPSPGHPLSAPTGYGSPPPPPANPSPSGPVNANPV